MSFEEEALRAAQSTTPIDEELEASLKRREAALTKAKDEAAITATYRWFEEMLEGDPPINLVITDREVKTEWSETGNYEAGTTVSLTCHWENHDYELTIWVANSPTSTADLNTEFEFAYEHAQVMTIAIKIIDHTTGAPKNFDLLKDPRLVKIEIGRALLEERGPGGE